MNKNAIRLFCTILALILIASSFSSCNKKPVDAENDGETPSVSDANNDNGTSTAELKLPFSENDFMNPFKAQSLMNRSLSPLLFDSLFTIDETFSANPLIAASFILSGNAIEVSIKPGISFHDGSPVTAADVLYSFEKAKTSPAYAERLRAFSSASAAAGASSVKFLLAAPNPYAVNLLDFAIVKKGSAEGEGKLDLPIGRGRYTMKQENGQITLSATADYSAKAPEISSAKLVNISDTDSVMYTLEIGDIDFIFRELADGSYKRVNAASSSILLNNLVYLGFNSAKEPFSSAEVRNAISLSIDRALIASSGYQGHAVAAVTPFNPKWTALSNVHLPQSADADSKAAKEKISAAKINPAKTFELLVNSENAFRVQSAELIVQNLSAAGIKAALKSLSFAEYESALKRGAYDMYIGELRLTNDMSLSSLLGTKSDIAYGINKSDPSLAAYSNFISGIFDLQSFVNSFSSAAPFVPLCYRLGIAAYSRRIDAKIEGVYSNVYASMDKWLLK